MDINPKIRDKAEKLIALAERGIDGEKENAKAALKNLLDKSGLVLSDVTDKEIDLEPLRKDDKNLLQSREYKPGIYDDISHHEYNAIEKEIVRNSYINAMEYCPAKARVEESKDTPSLKLGRAAHSFVLEGEETFNKEFAVCPTCDKRTKKGKEIFAEFQAENLTKTIVSEEDYVKIYGMNRAIRSHDFANSLLVNGISELTVIWEDEETGIMCRARPDRVPDGHNMLIDFKGTKDASEYGFDKSIATYRYYRQGAMYAEGVSKITGEKYDAFVLIGCEWEFPHRLDVVVIDPDYLAWGRQEFHKLLRLEKECRDRNYWPHYLNEGARDALLPAYMGL